MSDIENKQPYGISKKGSTYVVQLYLAEKMIKTSDNMSFSLSITGFNDLVCKIK